MTQPKQIQMIDLLLTRTRTGHIDWKPTPLSETISVSFDKASMLLTQLPSHDAADEHDYRVQIVGPAGDIVEEFKDVDFGENTRQMYQMMSELFELGRRKALGADAAIDSIIEELNNIIPF